MIRAHDLLRELRPLHVCVGETGHITQTGSGFAKLGNRPLRGQRFLEVFQVLRPLVPQSFADVLSLPGQVLRLRLRSEPDILLRGHVISDNAGGAIIDISFGIAVVDAVQRFGLTAQDFAASDLAVELLFLQEAKSSAMSASFSLNARLNGARLAAESEALTDGLTGLYNRRALDKALTHLGQSETGFAVLHVDLDKFKQVNDTMGHAMGDAILKQTATTMRRNTRKEDVLARAGGDEFVIICPGLSDHQRLGDMAERLISQISEPVVTDNTEACVGASIGISLTDQDKKQAAQDVIERADIALYAAKRLGRGRFVFWTPDLGTSLAELDIPHVAHR